MFKILKKSQKSKARQGKLQTAHGEIETPIFLPIATKGAVKGVTPQELKDLKAQMILANTYHLFLRPGHKTIQKAGGLHKFIGWSRPILTDSGGYQVFSLAKRRKIKDKGVVFCSEIDGKKHLLTPELALEIQQALNSDIILVLDECVPFPCSYLNALKATERTTDWAKRSLDSFQYKAISDKQMLFGIIQGSIYKDLRLKSVKEITSLNFDGYAIGGLAVGEPKRKMIEVLKYLVSKLPKEKPRYLLGVGMPEDIVKAVNLGIDMFDCVIPTRNARHGMLFVWKKKEIKGEFYSTIKIKNSRFKQDFRPLDKNCSCLTCQKFTRAYLHHLFIIQDFLGQRLATLHNLKFYLELMEKIKQRI